MRYWLHTPYLKDLTEVPLRDQVLTESACQLGITVKELQPYVDGRLLAETVNPILHEVSIGVYATAANAGKLEV